MSDYFSFRKAEAIPCKLHTTYTEVFKFYVTRLSRRRATLFPREATTNNIERLFVLLGVGLELTQATIRSSKKEERSAT